MNDCEVCYNESSRFCDVGRVLQSLCKMGDIEMIDTMIKRYNHALPTNIMAFAENNLETVKYINETWPDLIIEPIEEIEEIENIEVDRYLFRERPELYTEYVLRWQLYNISFYRIYSIEKTMTVLRYLHSKPGMADIDMDFNKMKNMRYPYEIAEFIFSNFKFSNFMEALDDMKRNGNEYKYYSRFVRGG